MGNMAKSALGQRIMSALEQVANDQSQPERKRKSAAKKLAEWQKAAAE